LTQPLVVSLPHSLGKTEALRRLKTGLSRMRSEYAQYVDVTEEVWNGHSLTLRAKILKQSVAATIEVGEDYVRVEAILPFLLGQLARGAQAFVQSKGSLLLEKK
jgi:hypothetical protein